MSFWQRLYTRVATYFIRPRDFPAGELGPEQVKESNYRDANYRWRPLPPINAPRRTTVIADLTKIMDDHDYRVTSVDAENARVILAAFNLKPEDFEKPQ